MRHFPFLIFLLIATQCFSQSTKQSEGIRHERPGLYALTNAHITTSGGTIISNATLIVKNGKVEAVGNNFVIPAGAIVMDCKGAYIYPSFIDLYTNYGITEPPAQRGQRDFNPQLESLKPGPFYWNEGIKPEVNGVELFKPDEKAMAEWRKAGFGALLSGSQDGIARGTAAFHLLSPDASLQESVIKPQAATLFSLSKGSSRQSYPSSLMGTLALLRQFHIDAEWYAAGGAKLERNLSLEAYNRHKALPHIMAVQQGLDVFRVLKIAEKFKLNYMIVGTGDEYRRISELKKRKPSLIIPVNFPAAYEVSDPLDAQMLSLSEMWHWEYAPYNPAMLADSGIEFSFTAHGLKSKAEFLSQIRIAVQKGLSYPAAIRALSETPAKQAGMAAELGTLAPGNWANFIICSDSLFKPESQMLENWSMGSRSILKEIPAFDLRGAYHLQISGGPNFTLNVGGSYFAPNFELIPHQKDSAPIKPVFSSDNGMLTLQFSVSVDSITKNNYGLTGFFSDTAFHGTALTGNGVTVSWGAKRVGPFTEKEKPQKPTKAETKPGPLSYPFMAYGWTETPRPRRTLIKNTTVWTNEKDGIIQNADVLIDKGVIVSIGKNLSAGKGDSVVDGTGKHLTSGIIDEHSHIAIARGVNEGGQAITAEVSIGDVVNSEDINIYRQLAGGVTAAQLLHGSANPIGGQSALIKFRWGAMPEDMKIKDAAGFIKFALGENPKNSNSGSFSTQTYPQTRMGVEQVMYQGFYRARAYAEEMKAYNALSAKDKAAKTPPRRDEELDILLEILNGRRFISCHSYVQSEIVMLMTLADSFGFKVNTFTHILEGYKVADKMKTHGVAASTFADWWAYKWEVNDAIPYNAAILQKMGIVTAVNSDDAEMGRRLNQEAAKAVKYGGVSEEEAWKMVTLNPAKMLRLDKRMGSIATGKDADLVLWNTNPLSIYAKPAKTWVDGIEYFDARRDMEMREFISKERQRLIDALLAAKEKDKPGAKPPGKKDKLYHCEDLEEMEESHVE